MSTGRRFSLNDVIARMQEEPRLRQRAAALGGVSAFFAGGLIAVGLGQVVLVLIAVAVIGGGLALVAWRVPHNASLLRGVTSAETRRRVATLLAWSMRSARHASINAGERAAASGAVVAAWVRRQSRSRATQPVARATSLATGGELYGWPYAGSAEIAPGPSSSESRGAEERERALDLNARGSHLRRAGSPTAASSLHLEALQIFRSLNDRGAQALTLNSLALALAASGEIEAAVERFEQSLSILRERPENPEEAQVIANLGFTLLRQGGDDRARELLSEALEKLPPDSRAAHKVEAQLRRAS
jgi:tetratricopeptide (TPR) repeat protein